MSQFICWKRKPAKRHRNKSSRTRNTSTTNRDRDDGNEQSFLTHKERRKLRRLRRDGIIILIDQRNLEYDERERMQKKGIENWTISYGQLVEIIATCGYASRKCREVLATYIVTSKRHQVQTKHRPSSKYLERNCIDLIRSPDERTHREEKAVDTTLVRIMTQAFEGIEILRLTGMRPPKRTFCLVTGDYDFIDVVQKARECCCDVELWFWEKEEAMSKMWKHEEKKSERERYGSFTIKDLGPFRDKLTRHWRKSSEAWSVASGGTVEGSS